MMSGLFSLVLPIGFKQGAHSKQLALAVPAADVVNDICNQGAG